MYFKCAQRAPATDQETRRAAGNDVVASAVRGDEGDPQLGEPVTQIQVEAPVEMAAVAVEEAQRVDGRVIGHGSRSEVRSTERNSVGVVTSMMSASITTLPAP